MKELIKTVNKLLAAGFKLTDTDHALQTLTFENRKYFVDVEANGGVYFEGGFYSIDELINKLF